MKRLSFGQKMGSRHSRCRLEQSGGDGIRLLVFEINIGSLAPAMKPNAKKRVLVTGGAGFLGSFLCERLLAGGYQVICVDNFDTGSPENIEPLLLCPDFTLLRHDVTQPIDVDVDEIYNLACPASPIHYQRDPLQTIRTNVLGAMNMLELAKTNGAKILQASTSEVYGDPKQHPQTEEYWGNVNPIGPRSCYDEGKRCAETLFFDYHRQYKVRIKIVRIFNTYGPRMNPGDGRVVSNFVIQALCHEPLTLFGDGLQTRSFCYVSDLVEGLISLMQTADVITGPVNMGNPAECTMVDLAELILRLTSSPSPIVYHPLPEDDPQRRRPDISLAEELLNWVPCISLEEGLCRTVEYFRDLYCSELTPAYGAPVPR